MAWSEQPFCLNELLEICVITWLVSKIFMITTSDNRDKGILILMKDEQYGVTILNSQSTKFNILYLTTTITFSMFLRTWKMYWNFPSQVWILQRHLKKCFVFFSNFMCFHMLPSGEGERTCPWWRNKNILGSYSWDSIQKNLDLQLFIQIVKEPVEVVWAPYGDSHLVSSC